MAESITSQIAELHRISVAQLRTRLEELTGRPCRQTHRKYLIKRAAFKIQELHYGGLSEEAKDQIADLQKEFEGTTPDTWFSPPTRRAQRPTRRVKASGRDPRLPAAGTVLKRDYRGTEYAAEVTDGGFVFEGQPFRSLSGVAQAICGCHVNGFSFFRLNQRNAP